MKKNQNKLCYFFFAFFLPNSFIFCRMTHTYHLNGSDVKNGKSIYKTSHDASKNNSSKWRHEKGSKITLFAGHNYASNMH